MSNLTDVKKNIKLSEVVSWSVVNITVTKKRIGYNENDLANVFLENCRILHIILHC